jgi:hypothetical protein
MRLTGYLSLTFESSEYTACYEADITMAVLRPNELVFDFRGHDLDEGKYKGDCKLKRDGSTFQGSGEFRFEHGGSTEAEVRMTCVEESETNLILVGEWQDEGDLESYTCRIELEV